VTDRLDFSLKENLISSTAYWAYSLYNLIAATN